MAVASPEQPVSALKDDHTLSASASDTDSVDDVEEIHRDDLPTPPEQKPDFGLQIGFEELLVDVDPHLSLEYLQKADALAGKPPPQRTPREKLIETHNVHVEKQRQMMGTQKKVPKMVKKVILALSYAPSSKPYEELTKVSRVCRLEGELG